jgi:two-component system, NarL family, response regulator NreC
VTDDRSSAPVTVVIADDHAAFRQGLRLLLGRTADLQLTGEADNGQDALALIEALHPAIAVLDIRMPKLDGLEVARRSCASSPGTKIVILTMHDDPDLLREALEIGVGGYVVKDDAAVELAACVRTVADGGHYISARLSNR